MQTTAITVKRTPSFQDEIPFEIVGEYLGQLCNEKSIADHLLFSRNQPSKGTSVSVDELNTSCIFCCHFPLVSRNDTFCSQL